MSPKYTYTCIWAVRDDLFIIGFITLGAGMNWSASFFFEFEFLNSNETCKPDRKTSQNPSFGNLSPHFGFAKNFLLFSKKETSVANELKFVVLGKRLPKFTVFGSSVNLAARMEQTSVPNRIRMTKDFYDLLPESDGEIVEASETIRAKNMGKVEPIC
jgi:hypothetical protein